METYYSRNRERIKKYAIERYRKNPEIQKLYSKTYHILNRDKIRIRKNKWEQTNKIARNIKRNKRTGPNISYKKYKYGAKTRNHPFLITLDEFKLFWQKPCTYCGDPIQHIGLDRVDNSIGYELNNIVSCCSVCNRMKMTLNKDVFLKQCLKIVSKKQTE
jgi:hypothetical protein